MSILFGASYYPEHRDPEQWAADLDLVAKANMNILRVGEFAWPAFEPSDEAYDFGWMDRFVELAAARKINIMMSAPLRTAPAWLVEQDSSILILNSDGVRLGFGSRYTFCVNHPLLRRKGFALAGALAGRYGACPTVTSWHLDNEYGDEPDCHCAVCADKWRAWLATRYGSIAALNKAWGTVFWGLTFNAFRQVPTPRKTKTFHNPALWLAWRQFRSDCTSEAVSLHRNAINPHIAGKPVTTNFQTLWNCRTDYAQAARHLDVSGVNYYPVFGAESRERELGLAVIRASKGKGFWVLETAPGSLHVPGLKYGSPDPDEVSGLFAHMIGNGADGVVYFRWSVSPFGAEQHICGIAGYDGRPRRGFDELRATGARLKRLEPLLADTEVRSEVAVFYDFQTRWYLEDCGETTGSPWMGPRDLFLSHAKMCYRALRAQGVNVDVAGRHTDLSMYKLVVVPMLPCVDDELAGRLCAFVRQGGTLVWHPYSGICDREATIYPRRLHPELAELFGIRTDDFAALKPGEEVRFTWQEDDFKGRLFLDLVETDGATAAASFSEGWMSGRPAVTERMAGAGRAIHVAIFAEEMFYRRFLPVQLNIAGVRPILPSPLPEGAEISARMAPDGSRVIFLINRTSSPVRMALPLPMLDHWMGETLESEAVLGPYGVRVLTAGPEERRSARKQA